MSAKVWYAAVGKKKAGPYAAESIVEKISAGKLKKALFWRGGMEGWVPLGEVPEFDEARQDFEKSRKRRSDLKQKNSRIKEARQKQPGSRKSAKAATAKRKSRKSSGPPPLAESGTPPPLKAAGGPPPLAAKKKKSAPPPAPAAAAAAAPASTGGSKPSKPVSAGLVYLQIFVLCMFGLYFAGCALVGMARMAPADSGGASAYSDDGSTPSSASSVDLWEAEWVDFDSLADTRDYTGKLIQFNAWWTEVDGTQLKVEEMESDAFAMLDMHPDALDHLDWMRGVEAQEATFYVQVPENFDEIDFGQLVAVTLSAETEARSLLPE